MFQCIKIKRGPTSCESQDSRTRDPLVLPAPLLWQNPISSLEEKTYRVLLKLPQESSNSRISHVRKAQPLWTKQGNFQFWWKPCKLSCNVKQFIPFRYFVKSWARLWWLPSAASQTPCSFYKLCCLWGFHSLPSFFPQFPNPVEVHPLLGSR